MQNGKNSSYRHSKRPKHCLMVIKNIQFSIVISFSVSFVTWNALTVQQNLSRESEQCLRTRFFIKKIITKKIDRFICSYTDI